jgi:uncharacterized membrane protein YkvA (DUF1232 family)
MFAMWRLWRRVGGWRALVAQVLLAWRLAKDPRVPGRVKLILPAPLLYFFTPLNLAFEWIPFFGQVDDIGVVMLAVGAFLRACPKFLVAEHAARLENEMQDERRFERIGRFGKMGRYVRPSFKQWSDAIEVMPRQGRAAAARGIRTARVSGSEDGAKAA